MSRTASAGHAHRADRDMGDVEANLLGSGSYRFELRLIGLFEIRAMRQTMDLKPSALDRIEVLDGNLSGDRIFIADLANVHGCAFLKIMPGLMQDRLGRASIGNAATGHGTPAHIPLSRRAQALAFRRHRQARSAGKPVGNGLDADHVGSACLTSPHLQEWQCSGEKPDGQRAASQSLEGTQHHASPAVFGTGCRGYAEKARAPSPNRQCRFSSANIVPWICVLRPGKPAADIHVIHQHRRERPLANVRDAITQRDLRRFGIDGPSAGTRLRFHHSPAKPRFARCNLAVHPAATSGFCPTGVPHSDPCSGNVRPSLPLLQARGGERGRDRR